MNDGIPISPEAEAVPELAIQIDGPLSGGENMAIDNAMLERAVTGESTLRFYQWAEPTITLGHFQDDPPLRFAGMPFVKRLSGGGAILHDKELTYSIAIPKEHPFSTRPGELYDVVHDAIMDELRQFGVESQLRGEAAFADKPFLCFARGDARDIVMVQDGTTHKIVGSAQRRRRGAILQHGSILLAASQYAEEFPGIEELASVPIDPEQLTNALVPAVVQKLTHC